MYTDEQFEHLEQEERDLTDEAIAVMILVLSSTKNNLERELRNFYQKYGKDGVITYSDVRKWVNEKDHRRRLSVLLLLVSGEFSSALSNITPQFKSFLGEVISKESGFFDVDVDVEDVLSKAWGTDGATWLERLEADVELWNAYVSNDLKRSFLRREHIDKVIKRLDKRFDSIERIIQKLAYTESTAIGSLARREIFKELGVTKYRYYAREDERTCETCGSMHGLTFPMTAYEVGVTASPMHPWCRCWEVPIWE
jgi:SPP1 gp7 family putative phage head morphogenesis protein